MHCKYCPQIAAGINYRPNTLMENIPACHYHATSLFIPFTTPLTHNDKHIPSKLEKILQKLIDSIVAEFNLIKSEVLYHEQQMSNITQSNAITFRMDCQLTTPYVIIPADEELLFSTLLKRIKLSYEREKVEIQRKSLYDSRIVKNQAELLKNQYRPSSSKEYLFLTPQTTERTRLVGKNSQNVTKFLQQCKALVEKKKIKTDQKIS